MDLSVILSGKSSVSWTKWLVQVAIRSCSAFLQHSRPALVWSRSAHTSLLTASALLLPGLSHCMPSSCSISSDKKKSMSLDSPLLTHFFILFLCYLIFITNRHADKNAQYNTWWLKMFRRLDSWTGFCHEVTHLKCQCIFSLKTPTGLSSRK